MPRLAIVSDTHVPSRADIIPDWVREEIAAADHVVHAGDFDDADALATVRELATELTAVHGNMDPRNLDLPTVATVTVGGVPFVVTHGTGSVEGYRERVAGIVHDEDPDAVGIAGHTHSPLDEEVDGVRLLNPGSATGAAPASEATMLVADVADGDLDVTLRTE